MKIGQIKYQSEKQKAEQTPTGQVPQIKYENGFLH